MAMVGLHKGNSNGNRGGNKPYGMMLILAFGAALIGVMMIHKLRERRIFNLLVKEKDHQLISLQLLLQKEREYTKEMKRKAEEMKTKIYSLRNQNMEADRRILEMQSTIHSLKDERKILESALDERQNEIKLNRKKLTGQENKNPEVTALMESLKQKEAEIEDLKRHLESSIKRWSVGTNNDLLKRRPNFNLTGNLVDNETRASQIKAQNGKLHDSANYSNGVNLLERGDGVVDASAISITRSENGGRLQNTSESKGSLSVNEENNTAYHQQDIVATTNPYGSNSEMGTGSAYHQQDIVARDEQMKLKSSEQDAGQDDGTINGGLKLEMAENSRTSNARMNGKYVKEKRWRKLHRNRRLVNSRNDKNNETEGIGKRKIPVDNQNQLRDREEATTSYSKGSTDSHGVMSAADNQQELSKLEDLSKTKLLKSQRPEDSEDVVNKPVMEDTVQHLERSQATSTRSNTTKESSDSDGIHQHENKENYGREKKMQDNAAQVNDVKHSREEEEEEDEAADLDNGTDKATGEFDRELVPDLEENREYKEETEESEF